MHLRGSVPAYVCWIVCNISEFHHVNSSRSQNVKTKVVAYATKLKKKLIPREVIYPEAPQEGLDSPLPLSLDFPMYSKTNFILLITIAFLQLKKFSAWVLFFSNRIDPTGFQTIGWD